MATLNGDTSKSKISSRKFSRLGLYTLSLDSEDKEGEEVCSNKQTRFEIFWDWSHETNVYRCSLSRGRLLSGSHNQRYLAIKISSLDTSLEAGSYLILLLDSSLNPLGSGTQTLRNWNRSSRSLLTGHVHPLLGNIVLSFVLKVVLLMYWLWALSVNLERIWIATLDDLETFVEATERQGRSGAKNYLQLQFSS